MSASGAFLASFLFRGCGRCHACGSETTPQNYCQECKQFRRYTSHGYPVINDDHDTTPCPSKELIAKLDKVTQQRDDALSVGTRLVEAMQRPRTFLDPVDEMAIAGLNQLKHRIKN